MHAEYEIFVAVNEIMAETVMRVLRHVGCKYDAEIYGWVFRCSSISGNDMRSSAIFIMRSVRPCNIKCPSSTRSIMSDIVCGFLYENGDDTTVWDVGSVSTCTGGNMSHAGPLHCWRDAMPPVSVLP